MPRTRSGKSTAEKATSTKVNKCTGTNDPPSDSDGDSNEATCSGSGSTRRGSISSRSSPSPSPPPCITKLTLRSKRRHDGLPVNFAIDASGASTSFGGRPEVFYKLVISFEGSNHTFFVPSSLTVGRLKDMLFDEVDVPSVYQDIIGWKKNPQSDETILEECLGGVPAQKAVRLCMKKKETIDRSLKKVYTFKISDEKGRNFTLQLPGCHKVSAVKTSVAKLSDIPTSQQKWKGWPRSVTDDTYLANAGLNEPFHELKLKISNDIDIIDLVSSSSSQDMEESPEREVFGGDEQVFVSDSTHQSLQPLVPPEVEDEIAGSVHFIDTFILRYGTNCPQFFSGTLQDAMREACLRPMSERRLLAIYLHHDESVLSNIFCSEVLCSDSIIQTLSANFVLWGWDITTDAARLMYCNSVNELVGPSITETISKFSVENYPLLIILTRPRRNVDLFNIITGNNSVSDLLSLLIHAVDVFTQIQQAEVQHEEERCLRENIKDEQDRAFEESLLADRAKDEAKRQQEFLIREETERLKRLRQEEEAKREAERVAVESELPPEPCDGAHDTIIKARIRTPTGEILHRKFLAVHSLKVLFNYLLVKGYRTSEFKVISGWPRKDLTVLDPAVAMKDLKLANQETFILEER